MKNKEDIKDIPKIISHIEKIVRVLLYPKMVTKNEVNIRSNAFRTPPDIDEVSVIRLDYCIPDFCKKQGKKIQDQEKDRSYFGLAVLNALEIRSVNAEVVYTPKYDNFVHADIKIGYVPKKGEQLPAKYQYKVDEMARIARMYKDPNPDSKIWEGEELI